MSTESTSPPAHPEALVYDSHDLESITLLLELGAIELTHKPDDTFSFDDLLREANAIDPKTRVHEADARIVLPLMKSIRRLPGARYALK